MRFPDFGSRAWYYGHGIDVIPVYSPAPLDGWTRASPVAGSWGAVVNQRPDLFAAELPGVGLMDSEEIADMWAFAAHRAGLEAVRGP